MKDARVAYLAPLVGAVALLVVLLMAYAGFLTADWGTLLACAPAVLVTIGIVSGMTAGMILFSREEDETAREAARAGGVEVFDGLGHRIEDAVHRVALRLHGVGH